MGGLAPSSDKIKYSHAMGNDAQIRVAKGGPDIGELLRNYSETTTELNRWFSQCQTNNDDRHNIWPGKRPDHRKAGPDSFPWEGASDQESMVVGERINAYVSLCMFALTRAHIRAYPVESSDTNRARLVSSFLKWMRDSYIEGFSRQMELGCNYLFEKAHMITFVGWEKRSVTRLQIFDLQQIAAQAPEFAEMLMDPTNDVQIVGLLQSQFPLLKKARAKKALRQLRKTGRAELPVAGDVVDRPVVESLATDTDIFYPHYCTDPQTAPFIHRRVLMTPQQILSKVADPSEPWDKQWADYLIEHLVGQRTMDLDMNSRSDSGASSSRFQENSNDFIEVIYTYQRLIDPDDGSEGIYCTVWSQGYTEGNAHGLHYLLNGMDDYPFVFTELHRDNKRVYDAHSMVDLLRGTQWQVKAERDARVDRASLATLVPSVGPTGVAKPEVRPGGHIHERRPGELRWMSVPPFDSGSIEIENTMLRQADRMVGLSSTEQDPDAATKRAFYLNKFLKHVRDVLALAYKNYLSYGPPEVLFRVAGVPEPQNFEKGDPSKSFDISVQFDSQMTDPETTEKKLQQMLQLVQYDRTGKIDIEALLEFAAAAVDPVLAEVVIQPRDQAQQKAQREVAEDLTKIYSGIEIGARPNAAQVAMQMGQTYMQQPDIQQRMQEDEAFSGRLTKYFKQYEFQLQQQTNAQTGKLGTEPAAFQGMQEGGE